MAEGPQENDKQPMEAAVSRILARYPVLSESDILQCYRVAATLASHVEDPLKYLRQHGLVAEGPCFDALALLLGLKIPENPEPSRDALDPPEVVTVLRRVATVEGKDEGRFVMVRDAENRPSFIAQARKAQGERFEVIDFNLFSLLHGLLGHSQGETKEQETHRKRRKLSAKHSDEGTKAPDFPAALREEAQKEGYSMGKEGAAVAYKKGALATCFHGLGVFAPYNDETTVGYRTPYVSGKKLRDLLTRLMAAEEILKAKPKDVQEFSNLLNFTNIAVDEGDYGTW